MRAAGYTGIRELPSIERWTKNGGKVLVRRWQGPPSLIGPDTNSATKAFALKQAGIDYEIQQESGQMSIISGTYGSDESQPANEPLTDRWFMNVNELEKDYWELPAIVAEWEKTLTAHGGISAQESAYAGAQAKRDIQAAIRGEVVEQDGREITLAEMIGVAALVGVDATVLWNFIQDMMKGTTTFTIDQYVLVHVRTVPESTAIQAHPATDATIDRMFTRASLLSMEGAPATVPTFGPLPLTGYWWKRRPDPQPGTTPGQWIIRQEYWHTDTFSTLRFGAAI